MSSSYLELLTRSEDFFDSPFFLALTHGGDHPFQPAVAFFPPLDQPFVHTDVEGRA